MPGLSVLIPVFQARPIFAQAIANVLGQTRLPNEIVVLDDGSSDGLEEDIPVTERRCDTAGVRLRYLRHPANRGRAAARNGLLEAATGPLIAWFDVDDLWDSRKLELQLDGYRAAVAERGPTGFIGMGGFLRADKDNVSDQKPVGLPAVFGLADLLSIDAPNRNIQLQTTLGPKAEFLRVGGFDPGLRWAEDFDFALRYAGAGGRFVDLTPDIAPLTHYFHGVRDLPRDEAIAANRAILARSAELFERAGVDRDAFLASKVARYLGRGGTAAGAGPLPALPLTELRDRLAAANAEKRVHLELSPTGDAAISCAHDPSAASTIELIWLDRDEAPILSPPASPGPGLTVPQQLIVEQYLRGARYLRIRTWQAERKIDRTVRIYRTRCGLLTVNQRPGSPKPGS